MASLKVKIFVFYLIVSCAWTSSARSDSLDELNASLVQLYAQGHYPEAVPVVRQILKAQEEAHGQDSAEVVIVLFNLGSIYFNMRQFSEAKPVYERALAIEEKLLGADDPAFAAMLNNVASSYYGYGLYMDAEPLFKRGLAILEKALGTENVDVATVMSALADTYTVEGRLADAEPLLTQALDVRKKLLGTDNLFVAYSMNGLANLYYAEGRFDDARPLYVSALTIRRRVLGPMNPDVAYTLHCLANLYLAEVRPADAESLLNEALQIREKTFGHGNLDVANTLSSLGAVYITQGRLTEAEATLKDALAIQERLLGRDHILLDGSLTHLGLAYLMKGKHEEGDLLLTRAFEIEVKAFGSDSPNVAKSLGLLAASALSQMQLEKAQALFKRALAIQERYPGEQRSSDELVALATLYVAQGRYRDAETILDRSQQVLEGLFGTDSVRLLGVFHALSELYLRQGHSSKATPVLEKSLAVAEKAFGPDNIAVAIVLTNLAKSYAMQHRYSEAEASATRSLAIFEKAFGPNHFAEGALSTLLGNIYLDEGRFTDAEPQFSRGLKIGETVSPDNIYVDEALNGLSFAYWSQGRDVEAIELARRAISSKNTGGQTTLLFPLLYGEMSKNVIAHEEGVEYSLIAFQQRNNTSAGHAINATAQRESGTQSDLASQVRRNQDLAVRIQGLEGELISAGSIDGSKRDTEAEQKLRHELAAAEEEFVQIQTELRAKFPNYVAFAKPEPLPLKGIQSLLATDEALVIVSIGAKHSYVWGLTSEGAEWKELDVSRAEVIERVKAVRSSLDVNDPHPFDAEASFELYKKVFQPIEGLINAKFRISLIVEGELAKIPLHVLVSADPSGKSFREMQWLVRSHAVTLIPAVSSLSVLRNKSSAAGPKPLLGFADPIFAEVMKLERLHDAADELTEIAQVVKADSTDLFFGLDATESRVKQTNLEQFRILYFATHALLAGQLANELSEAALVLTTPQKSTELDDGLLTASEVAQLKLDADWVVLSACNTGLGDSAQTESLSGLAQAFFYAGARSLLVSNWAVDTKSTAKLLEGIFVAIAADPTLSHAEALRVSMLSMIEGGGNSVWADPKFWGPFVVVGEPKKTIH